MQKIEVTLPSSAKEERIVSKPGATIEIKIVEIPPHIKEAVSRGLRLGREAAHPISKTT